MNIINDVTLYTDGSCLGNPGPGGWAAILVAQTSHGRHAESWQGACPNTTNNRMELAAVIAGLRRLKRPCRVVVVTDSRYVVNALSGGKMKANEDLIGELRAALQFDSRRAHQVEVRQVRGHQAPLQADEAINAKADALARAMAERAREQLNGRSHQIP